MKNRENSRRPPSGAGSESTSAVLLRRTPAAAALPRRGKPRSFSFYRHPAAKNSVPQCADPFALRKSGSARLPHRSASAPKPVRPVLRCHPIPSCRERSFYTVSAQSLGTVSVPRQPQSRPEAPFPPSVLGSRFRGCKSKGGTVQTANRAAHPIFPAEKPRQPASAPKRSTVGHQTQKADSSEPAVLPGQCPAVCRSTQALRTSRGPSTAVKSRAAARGIPAASVSAAPELRLPADQNPSAERQLRHFPCRAAVCYFHRKFLSAASPAQIPAPPPAPHPASTDPCRRRSRCRDVRRRFLR